MIINLYWGFLSSLCGSPRIGLECCRNRVVEVLGLVLGFDPNANGSKESLVEVVHRIGRDQP